MTSLPMPSGPAPRVAVGLIERTTSPNTRRTYATALRSGILGRVDGIPVQIFLGEAGQSSVSGRTRDGPQWQGFTALD